MSTTSNMNLVLPAVSQTLGPQWATLLNEALTLLDSHDHTNGKGALVPTAGLNLDADLPFNGYNATLLRSVRLSSQDAALEEVTDLGCIVNVGGNLYWNNGGGTPVQITDGAALSATSLGGISGLPSGTASAAFAASTFTWRQATNRAAVMDVGPLVIRDTAASALGITLQSPVGLAGAYSLTLPGALPGSGTKILRMSSAGTISSDSDVDGASLEFSGSTLRVKDGGVTSDKIASQAVTRPKLAAVGQQVSSGSSVDSTTSTSYVNVTNLSVTITTSGRPVVIACISDDSSGGSAQWRVTGSATFPNAFIKVAVSGSATADIGMVVFTSESGGTASYPPSALWHVYAPSAGTYTFQVQAKVSSGLTLAWQSMKLIAYEL